MVSFGSGCVVLLLGVLIGVFDEVCQYIFSGSTQVPLLPNFIDNTFSRLRSEWKLGLVSGLCTRTSSCDHFLG